MDWRPPRVCMLTEGFYPPAIGGQEKYVHDLAVSLVAQGVEVMVITRQSDPPATPREVVDGISVIRVPPGGQLTGKGWNAIIPLTFFLSRVFRLLLKERRHYDVMLVSGLKILPLPAVVVGTLLNKRCVIRPESPIELWQDISAKSLQRMGVQKTSRLMRLLRAIRYRIVKRADCVVAISSQIKDGLLAAHVHAERIAQIPNGIDISRFYPADKAERPALREKLGLPAGRTVFVYTGRLTTSKGIPELIRVWKRVTERQPDIFLALVGSGADCFDDCELQLRRFIEDNRLQHCISLPGAVTNVSDYLRASDLFIFPSHYEGFGLSIIEAMACGLPSIVSKVGVALDAIQDYQTGISFDPGNEPELESAVLWMLKHEELWPEIGGRARRNVVAKYSMDAVVSQYMNVFAGIQKPNALRARNRAKLMVKEKL